MVLPCILYDLSEPDLTVLPGVEATFALPELTIASGDQPEVELSVRNISNTDISFQTDRPPDCPRRAPRNTVGCRSVWWPNDGYRVGDSS
jgi:hypothetical protein